MNVTGTGNTTLRIGGESCWRCGAREWFTKEDLGYFWTLCNACGNEGPPRY